MEKCWALFGWIGRSMGDFLVLFKETRRRKRNLFDSFNYTTFN